jgi:hypothetical protein
MLQFTIRDGYGHSVSRVVSWAWRCPFPDVLSQGQGRIPKKWPWQHSYIEVRSPWAVTGDMVVRRPARGPAELGRAQIFWLRASTCRPRPIRTSRAAAALGSSLVLSNIFTMFPVRTSTKAGEGNCVTSKLDYDTGQDGTDEEKFSPISTFGRTDLWPAVEKLRCLSKCHFS